MLCPLLVIAINFFDLETAIFKGKSPNAKLLPAGLKDQPVGSIMFFVSCACVIIPIQTIVMTKKILFIVEILSVINNI